MRKILTSLSLNVSKVDALELLENLGIDLSPASDDFEAGVHKLLENHPKVSGRFTLLKEGLKEGRQPESGEGLFESLVYSRVQPYSLSAATVGRRVLKEHAFPESRGSRPSNRRSSHSIRPEKDPQPS